MGGFTEFTQGNDNNKNQGNNISRVKKCPNNCISQLNVRVHKSDVR